jgi:hypothetical protein
MAPNSTNTVTSPNFAFLAKHDAVHGHDLSQKVIEIYMAYAPSSLMKRPEFTRDNLRTIDVLHQECLDEYNLKDD